MRTVIGKGELFGELRSQIGYTSKHGDSLDDHFYAEVAIPLSLT